MTCEDFQLRLTAYSLGELDQDELQAARDHVAGCDDCASRALLDRQLTARLRAAAARDPRAGCDHRPSRALLARQLTALLRASAVPAPAETRAAVLSAVRAE